MCAAEVTLEPPDEETSGLHGWGVVHVCPSWEGGYRAVGRGKMRRCEMG